MSSMAVLQWLPEELRFKPGPGGRPRPRDTQYFCYGADFVPLGAGATATFNINIQADSDFLLFEVDRVATDSPAQTTFLAAMPATILVTDTGSGRQLMDRAQHVENWFGTGQLSKKIYPPFFIRASSTLQVTVQNLDTVNARVLRFGFHGCKVFG